MDRESCYCFSKTHDKGTPNCASLFKHWFRIFSSSNLFISNVSGFWLWCCIVLSICLIWALPLGTWNQPVKTTPHKQPKPSITPDLSFSFHVLFVPFLFPSHPFLVVFVSCPFLSFHVPFISIHFPFISGSVTSLFLSFPFSVHSCPFLSFQFFVPFISFSFLSFQLFVSFISVSFLSCSSSFNFRSRCFSCIFLASYQGSALDLGEGGGIQRLTLA